MRPTNIKKVAPKCCTLKATDQCGGIRVTLRSYPRAIQSLSREVKAAHIDRVSGQSGNGGPELELSNRSDLVETKTSQEMGRDKIALLFAILLASSYAMELQHAARCDFCNSFASES